MRCIEFSEIFEMQRVVMFGLICKKRKIGCLEDFAVAVDLKVKIKESKNKNKKKYTHRRNKQTEYKGDKNYC